MGLFDKEATPKFKVLFAAKPPDTLKKYIGRNVVVPGFYSPKNPNRWIMPHKVKIETICGNRFKPQFYEINGQYLVGMLRFHAQMLNDKSITEAEFVAFEEMEIAAEKIPQPPLDDTPRQPGEVEQ